MKTATQHRFKHTQIGIIPDNWEVKNAEDSCIKVTDGTHDSPKKRDKGKYLITSRHLKNGKLDFDNSYFISNEDFIEVNRRSRVNQWDVIFSMIGTVGEVYLERDNKIDYAIKNVGLFKTGSEIKGKWLYFYFKSKEARNFISASRGGTTQEYMTLESLRKFPIPFPKYEEEAKSIISILDSLQRRIELNQRMNKTLEAMGKALFKHWFIDFEFPNEEGKPYQSSGGEMADSELGGIPKAWKVGPLEDNCSEITRGFTTTYVERSTLINLNQKVNRGEYLDKSHYKYYPANTKVPNEKFARTKDILINSLGQGTLGRIHLFFEDAKNIVVDQHIAIVRAKEGILPEYLYFYLTFKTNQQRLESQITGSTGMLMLNISKIRSFDVVIPDRRILRKFSEVAESLYCKKARNNTETELLLQIRDSLLPKLMSGKLRVPVGAR